MSDLHLPRHTLQVTQRFVQGGLVAAIVAISLISAATLFFVWFVS